MTDPSASVKRFFKRAESAGRVTGVFKIITLDQLVSRA
jgi:hypothetical protein